MTDVSVLKSAQMLESLGYLPVVISTDRFADSLKNLAKSAIRLENVYKNLSFIYKKFKSNQNVNLMPLPILLMSLFLHQSADLQTNEFNKCKTFFMQLHLFFTCIILKLNKRICQYFNRSFFTKVDFFGFLPI